MTLKLLAICLVGYHKAQRFPFRVELNGWSRRNAVIFDFQGGALYGKAESNPEFIYFTRQLIHL